MMRLPRGVIRIGGVARYGCLFVTTLVLSSFFALATGHGAHALPSVGVQLPVSHTPVAPVTRAVGNVTGNLPVPVHVQNTPATVGASVATSQPAPVTVAASATLPAPVSAVVQDAVKTLPATVTKALSPSVPPVRASAKIRLARTAVTAHTQAAPVIRSASAKAPTKSSPSAAAPINGESPKPAAAAPSSFFSSIPSALSSIAHDLTGMGVDTFPMILAIDFLFVLLVLLAGLGGLRFMLSRA